MHQASALATGPQGSLGGLAAGRAPSQGVSYDDSLLTDNFDIYFRADRGLVNLGTQAGITLTLDGDATDAGNVFNIPNATSGITATGFSGDLDYDVGTGSTAGSNGAMAVLAVDLSDITSPGAETRLFGHKASTTSTAAGLQVFMDTASQPQMQMGDGTTALKSSATFDIEGEGKVVIFAGVSWFFANIIVLNIYDTGGTELAAGNANVSSLNDHTIGTSAMTFFAGHDGTDAAGGVSGTRTLLAYGGAFKRGAALTSEDMATVARSFA